MQRFSKKIFRSALGIGVAMFALGCGSASNNDQGVSVTFLGYYADELVNGVRVCSLDQQISATSVGLSDAIGESSAPVSQPVCIGMQNNMSSQFFRSQYVKFTYSVEGANITVPSTASPFSVVLGPIVTTTEEETSSDSTSGNNSSVAVGSGGSSLPPGFTAPQKVVGGVVYFPPELREFLSLNRASLPEPPFTMIVSGTVVGITSSGQQIETNPTELFVEVTPDVVIGESGGDDSSEDDTEEEE